MAKLTEYPLFTLCEFTLEEAKKILETGEIKIELIDSRINVVVHDPDEIQCRIASPKETAELQNEFQETGRMTWKPHKSFNF